jgi:hypothetical protein
MGGADPLLLQELGAGSGRCVQQPEWRPAGSFPKPAGQFV